MDENTLQRACEIYLLLASLEGPALDHRLDELAGRDQPLRDAVRAMLDARDRAQGQGFMASPTAQPHDSESVRLLSTSFNATISEKPGSTVGKYKLLQEIGHGGFGTVFMADQTSPVRRRVALKVIKLGMDTRLVLARFEAERQALALMDHPHIARILDAGATDGGRPYFVIRRHRPRLGQAQRRVARRRPC